jgi:Zn-finger protein
MRDNFSKLTKEILAKRVSFKCSNPSCKKMTIGSHSKYDKVINLGVAAHISAAAKGGPRFCQEMEVNERKSIKNGIWLCQTCAKLIDTDTTKYPVNNLIQWKYLAEKESLSVITNDFIKENQNSTLYEKRIMVLEKLYYEIREVDSLIKEIIDEKGMSLDEKRDSAFYLGLQIAQFTDDNGFYLQDEIAMQCLCTFVGVGDIFNSDEKIREESLKNYSKNHRASQRLLKNVDSKGIIDTTIKTPIMTYYSELEEKKKKEDFN